MSFLEPVGAQTSFTIAGELRTPRDGQVAIPLVRLPAAERETGGVAVDVIGAGEIGSARTARAGSGRPRPISANRSPAATRRRWWRSRYRAQAGKRAAKPLRERRALHAAGRAVANVEEARYDAL